MTAVETVARRLALAEWVEWDKALKTCRDDYRRRARRLLKGVV